jgi:hypothetical protein
VAHVGEELGLGLGGGNGLLFGSEEFRFGPLAIGDVFGRVEEILRISSGVPDDREGAVCNDDPSIAANEVLLPLVVVVFACDEFRVALCTGGTLVGVDESGPISRRRLSRQECTRAFCVKPDW